MNVFDEYPSLENDRLLVRKMSAEDADALSDLANDPEVCRFLPAFLYEQKYADIREVLSKMDEECFETRESVLMGIYLKEDPGTLVGIAEIYGFEASKPKVSIGYRLRKQYWRKGIAGDAVGLLKAYLMERTGVKTITAHVMQENKGSARVLIKNGFVKLFPNCLEDWGFAEKVLIDKYVFKRRWLSMTPEEITEETGVEYAE